MIKINFRQLTDAQKTYVSSHLNEEEETRDQFVDDIRQWFMNNGGPLATIEDYAIIRFLRSCKFNVEATKTKLMNFYLNRQALPEYFSNFDPFLPELQYLFTLGVILLMKNEDYEGRQVIIVRPFVYDPKISNISNVFKIMCMITDIALRDNLRSSIYGLRVIIDMTGISLAHTLQVTPKIIHYFSILAQNFYPVIIKGFHFINVPSLMNMAIKLFKSLINKKLQKRIYVHNDGVKDLLKIIPSDSLPVDYGGTGEKVTDIIKTTEKIVKENSEWLKEYELSISEWVQFYHSNR